MRDSLLFFNGNAAAARAPAYVIAAVISRVFTGMVQKSESQMPTAAEAATAATR